MLQWKPLQNKEVYADFASQNVEIYKLIYGKYDKRTTERSHAWLKQTILKKLEPFYKDHKRLNLLTKTKLLQPKL